MDQTLFGSLAVSFSVTGPICLVLLLGVLLRRWHLINDGFLEGASKLLFQVALPTLLFISILKTDYEQMASPAVILYGLTATLVFFLLLEWLAGLTIVERAKRGIFVQGAYRANMGILGLAYVSNAYGAQGLASAALYVGVVTILYNILAVITLTRSLQPNGQPGFRPILKGIATNPLIIAIVLALPFSLAGIKLPGLLLQTGSYFADMTLPLALLCTGASLNLKALRSAARLALHAAQIRLVWIPALITLGGWALGFRPQEVGMLFLISAPPTAAASYMMVRAMGGDSALAANIIALTTVGSLITTSIGVTLLNLAGLIG
ncbi:AEC family transporter [Pseudaeromonas paramecii]|uniref:AEC family transporter n=1 Tax=Pseudaeromonas paramecii TaxID=2138166 RepID=A0ABP8Q831_9GAMM